MKSLNTIQTLSKIGNILSRITFYFTVICICIYAGSIILLTLGFGEIFKIGDVTIYGLLGIEPGKEIKIANLFMNEWIIVCVGEAALAKFAEIYFKNELSAGTPFTYTGAKELMRLGILTMAVPTGCVIIAEILHGIISGFMEITADTIPDMHFDNESSIALGVMFIVMSVFCRYGAELAENKTNKDIQI